MRSARNYRTTSALKSSSTAVSGDLRSHHNIPWKSGKYHYNGEKDTPLDNAGIERQTSRRRHQQSARPLPDVRQDRR